ncbi:hypothetical protein EVAR_81172_1 [Eumeta japonica]|uniref:Uncharacterized protein n=1 Tax=Eumeta variegata TaxID=151549 RepID=A0A4C1UL46_EUMVA|nr:hypothetical protein EVAR_81172_1 [Eumeta japonica]
MLSAENLSSPNRQRISSAIKSRVLTAEGARGPGRCIAGETRLTATGPYCPLPGATAPTRRGSCGNRRTTTARRTSIPLRSGRNFTENQHSFTLVMSAEARRAYGRGAPAFRAHWFHSNPAIYPESLCPFPTPATSVGRNETRRLTAVLTHNLYILEGLDLNPIDYEELLMLVVIDKTTAGPTAKMVSESQS